MARYYPLIDCTPDGIEKVPMFFTPSFINAVGSGFALEFLRPNRYRLIATNPHEPEQYRQFNIRCPHCGKAMDIIAPHENNHSLALYACAVCE